MPDKTPDQRLSYWKKVVVKAQERIKELGQRITVQKKKVDQAENQLQKARKEARKHKIGTGPWQGSQSVIMRVAVPVADKFGIPTTSLKRAANDPLSISNPGSDHNAANTDAYAADFGTFDGAALAHAIAKAYGITNYSTGNYNSYYVTFSGKTFRIQILWAVSGHYNHVHVGAKAL